MHNASPKPAMQAEIAVAKVGKYATSESGDTVEMIERPHGGLSFVMADGQRSGKSAKAISNIVTRKVITLLGEGARDGVAARAAHDYLFAMRGGKVRADLQILTLDLESRTLVITRNTESPALLIEEGTVRWLDDPSVPIGIHRSTRPTIHELPYRPRTGALIFSDGVRAAGSWANRSTDVAAVIEPMLHDGQPLTAPRLADTLLAHAIEQDNRFPKDDLTVVALFLHPDAPGDVRRLVTQIPLP